MQNFSWADLKRATWNPPHSTYSLFHLLSEVKHIFVRAGLVTPWSDWGLRALLRWWKTTRAEPVIFWLHIEYPNTLGHKPTLLPKAGLEQ